MRNEGAMDHPPLSSPLVTPSHCSKLRHKGMYVAAGPPPAGYDEGGLATSYWCACTQTSFGPDGRPARADLCQHGRECCEH
jgi:hypothetical protein